MLKKWVISLIGGLVGFTASAQTITSESFQQLSGDVDKHKIQIYVEQLRQIQDTAGTPEQVREQINSNIYYTGMCSLEREMLFNLTKANALAADAAHLRAHYGFLSQAMERLNLVSAEQSVAEFNALRPQSETYLSNLYSAGSKGDDPDAQAAMLAFSDTCRQVTLAARSVDTMAVTRHQQGR